MFPSVEWKACFSEGNWQLNRGHTTCLTVTASSYLLLENLKDNKTGVAFEVRHMVITITILSPGFCNGFVSEVQFHILSTIKSPVLVIDSNAFLKWYRRFVTAAKLLLYIQIIGLRIGPAC